MCKNMPTDTPEAIFVSEKGFLQEVLKKVLEPNLYQTTGSGGRGAPQVDHAEPKYFQGHEFCPY